MNTMLTSDAASAPPASVPLPAAASRARWRRRVRKLAPYAFIAPFFILFGVFGLFPLLFSIWLSLHQWDAAAGLAAMHWVGLENYKFAITDPWFAKSLLNTLWFAVASGVPQHLVALPLAFLIHMTLKRSRNFVVGAYFVPYVTSSVAIALIFTTLFSKDFGVVNAMLPGPPIDWLGDAFWARLRRLLALSRLERGAVPVGAAGDLGRPVRGRDAGRRVALAAVPLHRAAVAQADDVLRDHAHADRQPAAVRGAVHPDPARLGRGHQRDDDGHVHVPHGVLRRRLRHRLGRLVAAVLHHRGADLGQQLPVRQGRGQRCRTLSA
jgi:hypothetical protein